MDRFPYLGSHFSIRTATVDRSTAGYVTLRHRQKKQQMGTACGTVVISERSMWNPRLEIEAWVPTTHRIDGLAEGLRHPNLQIIPRTPRPGVFSKHLICL